LSENGTNIVFEEEDKSVTSKAKNIEWKESLVKSVVYRTLTIILGFITAFIATGSLALAFGVALLTEFVQSINYFVFEVVWTNLITKRRLEEKIKSRMVDLHINYDSILELAYEMSLIDTFVEEVYTSAYNFFKSVLENEELADLSEEIRQHFEHFKRVHENRDFKPLQPIEGEIPKEEEVK